MSNIDSEFLRCVRNNNLSGVNAALKCKADVHIYDDLALRFSIKHYYTNIAKRLLDKGADIHGGDNEILKNLQKHFQKRIADVIFEYCNDCDYQYFPTDYVKSKIVTIKNARNI